ncbi:MAG: cyclohexanecarboxylate-CoA ligase [Stappia sp.]|uniref:class I adenylate-forming enzyme family protein n=1 Tax=Stappia sp. TaxID=1870903 RepID=UPI000C4FE5B1|nr:class I adenylate-forming enzyme family protein [Stappia sp.]MAA97125.1 cyclohexanecarboxylate-CoA ligase [Stappia sp.]MBM22401.1 cyclohexanecarboxylate-CoA ligase [Stappia sp.]
MRPFLTLHDPATARGYYESGAWQNDTFYDLLVKHANHMPSAPAIRDSRLRLDWRSLLARVDALADSFADRGIGAGDRISIWMSNRVEVIVAFLACSRLGVACNPSLHRSYTCGEIVDLLNELKPAIVITEDGWGADRDRHDFEAMVTALPFVRKLYTPADFPLHITGSAGGVHQNPDSVAYLAFTSGTTGKPKCVMHSSNTLLSNARDLVRDWQISSRDVILTLSPLSHHIAWVAAGQWLVSGAELVVDDPEPGQSRLDWVVATGATYVLGVPTHAMDILAEQKSRGMAKMGRVRVFYMAGAPIPEVLARSFVEQGITPQNIYGMTENSSHQYTHPDDPLDVSVATCGRGGRCYDVKIWDPEDLDRELPVGEPGEIGGRGALLMLGYYGNQEATSKSFNRHGYMMSGDLGVLDEHGNLKILGRSKDLIIRGGHNIFPSRIEALSLTHPGLSKAAAFPVPDERLGEKVCLAVIGSVEGEEILDHLAREGLSKFDMPEWFIAMEELPLTPSGKILKRELTEMVKRGDISPRPVRYAASKVKA